jgi:hypothetical protein
MYPAGLDKDSMNFVVSIVDGPFIVGYSENATTKI